MFVHKDIVFAKLWGCQDLICSENFRSDSTIGEADYVRRTGGTCCLLQTMTCRNVLLLYVQSPFFTTEVDEDSSVEVYAWFGVRPYTARFSSRVFASSASIRCRCESTAARNFTFAFSNVTIFIFRVVMSGRRLSTTVVSFVSLESFSNLHNVLYLYNIIILILYNYII